MSSPIYSNTPFPQNTQSTVPNKTDKTTAEQPASEVTQDKNIGEVKESAYATTKKQLNAAIIESSLKFNSTASNQPQSLVLKAALQGINEALKESGIEKTVEDTYESGIDYSPEATAERIVSFSTQLLGAYREQNSEMDEEELLTSFVNIISGGIDQGFSEAKDILGGLNVLEGNVSDNIDKTYELVQAGLQSFIESFNEKEEEQI